MRKGRKQIWVSVSAIIPDVRTCERRREEARADTNLACTLLPGCRLNLFVLLCTCYLTKTLLITRFSSARTDKDTFSDLPIFV
jgi:hypothetical protein